MSAAEDAAVLAVQEALDPGAVADRAVATAKMLPAAPRATAQRGRTGKVSWDPNQHKRGYHGRFAAGGGGQQAQQQRQLHDQGLYHGAIDAQHGPQTQAAIKALQQRYGITPTGKVDAQTAAVMAAPPPLTAQQVHAADVKAAAAAKGKGRTSGTSKAAKTRAANKRAAARQQRSGRKTRGTGRAAGGSAVSPGQANWQGNISMNGVLRQGDGTQTANGKPAARGNHEVQQVQVKLNQLGFDLGASGADGKFGTSTTAAIKAFQQAYGLAPDGVVGRATKLMLNLLSGMEGAKNPNALSIDQMPLKRLPRMGGKSGHLRQAQMLGVQQAENVAADYVREHLRT